MQRGEMLRDILVGAAALCVVAGAIMTATPRADDISARARKLHFASIVVDTHDDTTQRFLDGDFDLGVLRSYAALGVRYMTLTHGGNDEWADSSTDTAVHNGLTDFGKDVVREMNRLGMMVDISHVSDKTFYDALSVSKAPLIASHSSCRALCDAKRNMTDQMIKDLASKD